MPFLFAIFVIFFAGSTPRTLLKPELIKGFKNVPSFDAISKIRSDFSSLFNLLILS